MTRCPTIHLLLKEVIASLNTITITLLHTCGQHVTIGIKRVTSMWLSCDLPLSRHWQHPRVPSGRLETFVHQEDHRNCQQLCDQQMIIIQPQRELKREREREREKRVGARNSFLPLTGGLGRYTRWASHPSKRILRLYKKLRHLPLPHSGHAHF